MDKSRIFIASSGRTLVLAEKLRDELQTEFCEARLWSEEGKSQTSATIVEMLESATQQYDFAVIILARDDVIVREAGDTSARKARDNCVFEAGLFMAAIGRKRCFLVNSVKQEDLPSDLAGIISIPFEEPANLADRAVCAQAIARVAPILKDSVQRAGRSEAHDRVPLLSINDVFRREQPQSTGGDLREGQVLVCDLQPIPNPDQAVQVRRNLDSGIRYFYFLLGADDTVDRICQSLQVLLVGVDACNEKGTDFNTRLNKVKQERDRVLDDLRNICNDRSLQISLLPDEPQFRFRLHNATDSESAKLYMRYGARGYMLWAEGQSATSVWHTLPNYLPEDLGQRIFVPMKHIKLTDAANRRFENALDRGLRRYFPGIEDEVKRLCLGNIS